MIGLFYKSLWCMGVTNTRLLHTMEICTNVRAALNKIAQHSKVVPLTIRGFICYVKCVDESQK